MHFLVLLLASVSLLLASSSSASTPPPGFDYLVLALQWPGTVCRSSAAAGACCSSNACCRSDPIGWFTIHGLWPNYAQGDGPSCCNNNTDFDMAKISNLTTKLHKYWPSLYCSSPSLCSGGHGSLWAHEWEKHGTCSYPVIQDEYSYFSTALHLYSNYNVTAILTSKISVGAADDGGKYLVTDLVATIRSSFGASPLLLCERGSLRELRLCFDKDLKPMDCINGENDSEYDTVEQRSSCPRRISLPSYKLHGGDTSGATRRFTANKLLAFMAFVL